MADWNTTLTFEEDATFDTEWDQVVEVASKDHRQLTNRDANDQHPISAITKLADELNGKVESTDTISNLDILKIIGG